MTKAERKTISSIFRAIDEVLEVMADEVKLGEAVPETEVQKVITKLWQVNFMSRIQ